MSKRMLIAILLSAVAPMPASAQHGPSPAAAVASPYAPYDWLIGDWYGRVESGSIRELITYGPNRSYIRFSAFTSPTGDPQHLHFEGIALWNAKTKRLDYLFAVEPGSGVQESGTYRIEADGLIVREVELIDAAGKVGTGSDSAVTTVMRKTSTGWEPTFPGGDKIELTRRAAS
jgi:hypothetical protein